VWDYGEVLFGSPDGFMDGATVGSVGDTHTPLENNIGKVPTNTWRALSAGFCFMKAVLQALLDSFGYLSSKLSSVHYWNKFVEMEMLGINELQPGYGRDGMKMEKIRGSERVLASAGSKGFHHENNTR
jgi:hypothetical protein